MTELKRQLMTALRTLSAQYETEQQWQTAQVEALQQQVETSKPRGSKSNGSPGRLRAWPPTTRRSPRCCARAGTDAPAGPGTRADQGPSR